MQDNPARQLARQYISARHNHAAWRLLASPRAPLIADCLVSTGVASLKRRQRTIFE